MSDAPLSPSELQSLLALTERYRTAGTTSSETPSTSGAMNDASKRHRSESSERFSFDVYDDGSWEIPTSMKLPPLDSSSGEEKQAVVAPQPSKLDKKVSLPQGVNSIVEWGATLVELPAVKALKLSYKEICTREDQSEYLKWVLKHPDDKGPRVADLNRYLHASGYATRQMVTGAKLPGTEILRKYK